MKIIKVAFNNSHLELIETINSLSSPKLIELYNFDTRKGKKKAREMMERFGTKNLPLIVFENENLEEYDAIWSEQNPDWKLEISKRLHEI